MLNHECLEVYQVAIEFVVIAENMAENFTRGRAKLADQLSRASISIPLNIAEGAGLFNKKEKQRAYRIARGSAMECAAIVDIAIKLSLISKEQCAQGKEQLQRVVVMLTKLIQSEER